MNSTPSTVFLTGASSGIGAATARLLVGKGHRVFACARRREKLEELVASLPESERDSLAIRVLDVLDVEDHRKAVAECVDRFGGLDVAVPNAGLGIFDNLGNAALEDWHTMVDVNVKGVLTTLHCCLPPLREAKGLVVNIGSVASRNVFPFSGVYCATKHAVLALGEAIRQDLKSEVASTTICPGAVDTDFIEQTRNEDLLDQYRPNFKKGMHPDFIAEHVLLAIENRGRGIVSDITLRPDFL
jgi:NADP-dependent 3-hydroxy acid dehydrogenase YdfG